MAPKHLGRPAHPGRNALTRSGKDADGDGAHDIFPILPQMELGKIVGPHQPNEARTDIARLQCTNGMGSEPGAKFCLKSCDTHAGVAHHLGGRGQTLVKRCRPFVLQRIARADQPPNLIKSKPFQRRAGDMHMSVVRRIKRPPKKTNGLACARYRKTLHRFACLSDHHNRLCFT